MRLGNISEAIDHSNSLLDEFIFLHRLPKSWFDQGIDHAAVKAFNPDDYDRLIELLSPGSRRIYETTMDGRRLATAWLLGERSMHFVTSFDAAARIDILEIMEARPGEQSNEEPRLDHQEVYVPRGLLPIRKVLSNKGVAYLEESNRSHGWISVLTSTEADEIKFTDTTLMQLVKSDLAAGRSRVI